MNRVGKVEKKIYSLRKESPIVIPQIDPDKYSVEEATKLLRELDLLGVQHIAIGGSLIDPNHMQAIVNLVLKDYSFSFTTYITNPASALLKGKNGRSSIYWATVFNSENPFYLRDVLVMNSIFLEKSEFEPLPTAYVFDDRSSRGTANWLCRANEIPYMKPEISLANALACQYLGIRFYIPAGGSGSELPPSEAHISLLRKKTNLFLIPTSGIKGVEQARTLLNAGADAMHIGNLIEGASGITKLAKLLQVAKKFGGREIDL